MLSRLSTLALTLSATSCIAVTDRPLAATLHAVGYDTVRADPTAPGLGLDGAVDLKGVGVSLALRGSESDFLIGVDNREYEEVDAREYWAGLRYLVREQESFSPYVLGKLRYSDGLELPAGDSDAYLGWGLGFGVLLWATDKVYFDLSLIHEDLFQDADSPAGDIDLDGWVGTVGIGIAF